MPRATCVVGVGDRWAGCLFCIGAAFCLLSASSFTLAAPQLDLAVESRIYTESAAASTEGDRVTLGTWLSLDERLDLSDTSDISIELVAQAGEGTRRYLDAASFYWGYYADNWDLKAGLDTVFWGVLESNHLVDVINQDNIRESFHGEDKLGQPLVSLTRLFETGMLEVVGLVGTRKRVFLDRGERMAGLDAPIPVDSDRARYESARKEWRLDAAMRWSQMIGPVDYAVSYFNGTSRQPLLEFVPGRDRLRPFYHLVERWGLETQVILDHAILKLEAIRSESSVGDYAAMAAGLEYTQGLAFGSSYDIGYLLEYSYDDRDNASLTPFQNDLFYGLRLGLNDTASTEFIGGVTSDLDNQGRVLRVQFESRLSANISIDLDSWFFMSTTPDDVLHGYRDDSYIETSLIFYF